MAAFVASIHLSRDSSDSAAYFTSLLCLKVMEKLFLTKEETQASRKRMYPSYVNLLDALKSPVVERSMSVNKKKKRFSKALEGAILVSSPFMCNLRSGWAKLNGTPFNRG